MNLDKLNQWLFLASNIGVLAGIVFLALEIRQNSEALYAGSRQDLLEADLSLLDNSMDYPAIGDTANHDNLTGDDLLRLRTHYVSTLRIREFAWNQYRNGVLDEVSFESYMGPLRSIFDSKTGRDYLLEQSYLGDPEFEEYVIDYLGL